jgi:hypothetical protein
MGNPNGNPLTTILAIWGACTGTLALAWHAFVWWRSLPTISATAVAGYTPTSGPMQGRKTIWIRLTNRGNQPTTVREAAEYYFSNWFRKLIRHPSEKYASDKLVIETNKNLKPGDSLDLYIVQDETLELPLKKYRFTEIWLTFSHTNNPLRIAVRNHFNPQNLRFKERKPTI